MGLRKSGTQMSNAQAHQLLCYHIPIISVLGIVGLRKDKNLSPKSIAGFTEAQCGDWVSSPGAERAACGCKQTLVTAATSSGEEYEEDNALDLREETDIDLRTVE